MAQDKYCPLNIEGICFELVAHGFHEKQVREWGIMKVCDMGKHNGYEITNFNFCKTYDAFQNVGRVPGITSQKCYDAIQDAKYHGKIDGRIIDLKSRDLLIHSPQK